MFESVEAAGLTIEFAGEFVNSSLPRNQRIYEDLETDRILNYNQDFKGRISCLHFIPMWYYYDSHFIGDNTETHKMLSSKAKVMTSK